MIVYLHGSPDKPPVAEHTVIVCPAVDVRQPVGTDGKRADPPADWVDYVDGETKPKQIPVKFFHGQAEVPDLLGKYMVERGLAQKTRLILPNPWDR
jgi:hypothetical protein